MPLSIPFFTDLPIYQQEITLDTESYILQFTWNVRSEQWSMNILLPDETLLVAGIKLVLNYSLLDQVKYKVDLPPGEFYCIDTTGNEEKITRRNLGDTVLLTYIPESEL